VGRAVGDRRAAVSDGVDNAGVEGRGGQRNSVGDDLGRTGRAVRDGRSTVSDGDDISGVSSRGVRAVADGSHGTGGQDNSSKSVTHFDG
jgi:hypothetical protein